MPKGYRVIDRSPVFDDDTLITPPTGKPNLELTAAEDHIIRIILGGQGWKEGIRTTPVAKKIKPSKTATDTNTERKGLKTKGTTPAAKEVVTTPPPVLGGELVDEDEEPSPKKPAHENGGDSADEAKDDEPEEEVESDDVAIIDLASKEAETQNRLARKRGVLADYQKIFEIYDSETRFDNEGATEDQIDDRIQALSLILSGKVVNARGEDAGGFSEAVSQQKDFTHRIEGLHFLRTRKRRQIIDDGQSDEESNMADDPNQGTRAVHKAKRKVPKPAKSVVSSTNNITSYFSSPRAKKNPVSSPDKGGDKVDQPETCYKCTDPKETNCGICQVPLCSTHAQVHVHDTDQTGTIRPKPLTESNKRRVTFTEVVATSDFVGPLLEEGEVSDGLNEEEEDQSEMTVDEQVEANRESDLNK